MQAAADQQQGSYVQCMCLVLWNSQLTSVQIGDGGGFLILEQHRIIYPTKLHTKTREHRADGDVSPSKQCLWHHACGTAPWSCSPPWPPQWGGRAVRGRLHAARASSQCRSQPMG